MTCVVGLVDRGRIILGADSAGVSDLDLTVRADEKVFKNGPFVIGICGSFRMGQLLRYSFTPPTMPKDEKNLFRYMVTDFVDGVRITLKDGGFAKKENEVESATESAFLVGVWGRLFKLDEDYQVGEHVLPYNAVGCGYPFAMGSLHTVPASVTPKGKVKKALEAAEQFSGGVRGPYHYVETR